VVVGTATGVRHAAAAAAAAAVACRCRQRMFDGHGARKAGKASTTYERWSVC
jgi:hypothetical protein